MTGAAFAAALWDDARPLPHVGGGRAYRALARRGAKGNDTSPRGCDPGIRRIHAILENLQAKISRPPTPATASAAGPGRIPAASIPPGPGTGSGEPSGTVIPLSPVSPP